jgi:hypothetical protein
MTMETDQSGTKWWYNAKRKLHRDNDLPAVEFVDGDKYWYVNGLLHRNNGLPAIEYISGYTSGCKLWYIYNKEYTYEQVCNYYQTLKNFGRYCLKKIKMRRLRKVRYIHGELLCMPAKGSYPGGQDYHKMVSYFMSL